MALSRKEKMEKLARSSQVDGVDAKWKKIARWNREHADALEDYTIIASRILQCLKDKGMTQRQLAELLGVSPQALTRIVKGRQNLTLQTIRKIEKVLDISLITVTMKHKPTLYVDIHSQFEVNYPNRNTVSVGKMEIVKCPKYLANNKNKEIA